MLETLAYSNADALTDTVHGRQRLSETRHFSCTKWHAESTAATIARLYQVCCWRTSTFSSCMSAFSYLARIALLLYFVFISLSYLVHMMVLVNLSLTLFVWCLKVLQNKQTAPIDYSKFVYLHYYTVSQKRYHKLPTVILTAMSHSNNFWFRY